MKFFLSIFILFFTIIQFAICFSPFSAAHNGWLATHEKLQSRYARQVDEDSQPSENPQTSADKEEFKSEQDNSQANSPQNSQEDEQKEPLSEETSQENIAQLSSERKSSEQNTEIKNVSGTDGSLQEKSELQNNDDQNSATQNDDIKDPENNLSSQKESQSNDQNDELESQEEIPTEAQAEDSGVLQPDLETSINVDNQETNGNDTAKINNSLPQFLKEANQNAVKAFLNIEQNTRLSKQRIYEKKIRWAAAQSGNVQSLFLKFLDDQNKKRRSFLRRRRKLTQKLSPQAKDIDRKIQAIVNNPLLSEQKMVNEINRVLQTVPKQIRRELQQVVPVLGSLSDNIAPIDL